MKFRARDLPKPIEKPVVKEVVQPIVVVQQPPNAATGDDVKISEAKIILTLQDLNDKIKNKLDSAPKIKAWKHEIVRYSSGYIKEIISTPIFNDEHTES